jgi:hypothetical protein
MFLPVSDVTIQQFTHHVRDSTNVKLPARESLRSLDTTPLPSFLESEQEFHNKLAQQKAAQVRAP